LGYFGIFLESFLNGVLYREVSGRALRGERERGKRKVWDFKGEEDILGR